MCLSVILPQLSEHDERHVVSRSLKLNEVEFPPEFPSPYKAQVSFYITVITPNTLQTRVKEMQTSVKIWISMDSQLTCCLAEYDLLFDHTFNTNVLTINE